MMDELVIAVMSDLHAHNVSGAAAPSTFSISGPHDQPTAHPIAGLKKLIQDFHLSADMLLCPGDIADKAQPAALSYAWNEMGAIKRLLNADLLIATAGNHDMDSRYQYDAHDAKGTLQALAPMFPGFEHAICDRFWARNFAILDGDFWRLMVVNSSAYHGAGRDQGKEFQQGRVSRHTVEAIKMELRALPPKPLNIMLCHHHLLRDTMIAQKDYSEMVGADLILDALGGGEFGRWMVIHGHKHHPKLFYAPGGMFAPVIFSAGSLCARLYEGLEGYARNQFYVIRLPVSRYGSMRIDLAGEIMAWDWIYLKGWQPAGKDSGLPHRSGFGCRESFASIIPQVVRTISASKPYVKWSELTHAIPQLEFILPSDLAILLQQLNAHHRIEALFGRYGEVAELGTPL